MNPFTSFLKPVKMMDFALNFICIFGFCYQVYLILNQYMLGKTVVNIEVKRLTAQTLPAITVCIPALLDISKLKQFKDFNQQFYQDYIELANIIEKTSVNQTAYEDNRVKLSGLYSKNF